MLTMKKMKKCIMIWMMIKLNCEMIDASLDAQNTHSTALPLSYLFRDTIIKIYIVLKAEAMITMYQMIKRVESFLYGFS